MNDEKSPTDAILNPLNELIDEKESEILDVKNSFIDDDAIADSVIISKIIADDLDSQKFQLLYIANEIYILIHYAETGATNIVDKYAADEIPSELSADKTLFKLIASDVDKSMNPSGITTETTKELSKNIVSEMIASIIEFGAADDKDELKQLLKDTNDDVKSVLNEYAIKISAKVSSVIESKILKALDNDKEPSAKLLANYLNNNGNFFLEYTTRKRYMKTDKGFKEIKDKDVSAFFNDEFGYNEISETKAKNVLGFITREIETNYDLIQFANGTLNTDDEIFYENTFYDNVLPKLVVPFNYTENAETEFKQTDLYKENHEILKTNRKGWENNETMYYMSVGASGFAINDLDAMVVIVGIPNSRKSTLLSILKRIFKYSEVKLHIISENKRFQLIDCIAKDVNFDDDMQNFRITNIGNLNTFVSGNGIPVEIKGENNFAYLTAETTPIFWGASNSLPTIIGDGFERRLILILAENFFSKTDSKKSYMKDIKNGMRDDEIGLLFSYSIQLYWKYRDSPLVDETISALMIDEWEWKASPSKKGAELMFIDEYTFTEKLDELIESGDVLSYEKISGGTIKIEKNVDADSDDKIVLVETKILKDEVNKLFKEFHRLAFTKNRIFKEQLKPSIKDIKYAMSSNGFDESPVTVKFYDESINDYRTTSKRYYKDCILVDKLIGFGDWKDKL